MSVCNKDCESCRFDDCINDEMDAEDYAASLQRDTLCMDKRQRIAKEKNRARYLKRRDQQLAYTREYYRAHKKEAAEYHKKYNAEHRQRLNAQKRGYAKRNRGQYGQKQRALRIERLALGLTQKEAAKILGVSPSAVSHWERGITPCRVAAVIKKLREAVMPDAQRGSC